MENNNKDEFQVIQERCELCNFLSNNVDNIVFHKKASHPDVPLFTCIAEGCNKEFSRPFQLTKHMRLSHNFGTDKMDLVCLVCNNSFLSFKDLQKHSKIHNTEDFTCDICFKVFLSRSYLKKHLPTHEAKTFECQMGCDKKFSRMNKLDRHHKSVHTTSTDFVCSYEGCEKAYRRKDSLNDHIRTIHTTKQFNCDLCPKKFAKSCRLKRHLFRKHKIE